MKDDKYYNIGQKNLLIVKKLNCIHSMYYKLLKTFMLLFALI